MSLAPFVPVAATGLAIAFLHAALPTHWLPFVLVGRARGWSRRRTLFVAAFAGLGHVACTVALGALVLAAGMVAAPLLGRVGELVDADARPALGQERLRRGDQCGARPRLAPVEPGGRLVGGHRVGPGANCAPRCEMSCRVLRQRPAVSSSR